MTFFKEKHNVFINVKCCLTLRISFFRGAKSKLMKIIYPLWDMKQLRDGCRVFIDYKH